MKTDTATLIAAIRILARDIYCEDGVATATIAEAATRLEELRLAVCRLADQDATLSVCDGNVTVTMDATLTDAERDDLRVWRDECLRQCSTATEGANEELAERWQGRAKRAAAMIERLGGVG